MHGTTCAHGEKFAQLDLEDDLVAVVLIPIPERDFDPTEVAVSWRVRSDLGHQVRFATPTATAAQATSTHSPRASRQFSRSSSVDAPLTSWVSA